MFTDEVKNEVSGLCMTCNHAGSCVFLANASCSIWSCEEFDDRPPVIEQQDNLHEAQTELVEEPQIIVADNSESSLRKAS